MRSTYVCTECGALLSQDRALLTEYRVLLERI